jgi:hypothetical protein
MLYGAPLQPGQVDCVVHQTNVSVYAPQTGAFEEKILQIAAGTLAQVIASRHNDFCESIFPGTDAAP